MKRISSGMTRFHKKVFPVFWFGCLAIFVAGGTLAGGLRTEPMFLLVPGVMAVFGFFLMKKLVWDLVDVVFDYGDYLLVRNRDAEERIMLSDIMNVSSSTFMNPPRVTLKLVRPSKFGREIAFSPAMKFTLNPFAKNEIAEDLIDRAYRARTSPGHV